MTSIHATCLAVWLWLYSIHPALPWALIPLSSWLANWAIRRWSPTLWERCARLGPGAVGSMASKAFQALPSIVTGAIVSALASGLDLRQTVLGALVGLGAPIWHEFLKNMPGPYRGGMPPAASDASIPKVGPVALLVLLSLSGCATSLEAARVDGLAARRAATVGTAPSSRCTALDDRRIRLSGWAKGALGMAAASAAVLLIPKVQESTPGRITAVAAGGTFTATAGGLQLASDQTAESWARECP